MEEEKHFKYVILGGGVAAGYAAKEFAEQGVQPGELAIISKNPIAPYERSALSKEYLFLESPSDILVCPPDWYAEKGIELILNTTVVKAGVASKTLVATAGTIFKYDVLIIATYWLFGKCMYYFKGMTLRDWGFSSNDPKNVFFLRDIRDADNIREAIKAKKGGKAVIGGAPYISHEIASAMKMNNFDVSLHFPEPWFQLFLFTPGIAAFYEAYYALKGVEIMKETIPTEFYTHENGELKALKMTDGRVLEADIAVFILYNIPNASLFYGQLAIRKGGIKTDGNLRTNVPDVYAIGDVVTFPSKLYHGYRKVEQVDHARQSAQHAVKAIKANERGEKIDFYEYLPHQYSRPFDLSWDFYGENAGVSVMFGDPYSESVSKPKFGTYWVNKGKIVGTFLEGGTPEENEVIARVARIQPEVVDMEWLEVQGLDFACNI